MSWLGLVLIGFAVADLGHSVRPLKWLPESIAAGVVLAIGLVLGVGWPVVVIGLVVFAWGPIVRFGFGHGRALWALGYFVGVVALALVLSDLEGAPRWTQPFGFAHLSPSELVLLAGLGLVQLSTGNVVVRLVLASTGSMSPTKSGTLPASPLKGGRLLGPAERLMILGLGLAGNLTAASIVVAAKGLLRFPELNSKQGQEHIHEITEYFLVGSMMSWLFALASLALGLWGLV